MPMTVLELQAEVRHMAKALKKTQDFCNRLSSRVSELDHRTKDQRRYGL